MATSKWLAVVFKTMLIVHIEFALCWKDEAFQALNRTRRSFPGNEHAPIIAESTKNPADGLELLCRTRSGDSEVEFLNCLQKLQQIIGIKQDENPANIMELVIRNNRNINVTYFTDKVVIDEGGQGQVILGQAMDGTLVAIKLMSFKQEADAEGVNYRFLKGIAGTPLLLEEGEVEFNGEKYFALVLTRFGLSLEKLQEVCGGTFSLDTSTMIILHMIRSLKPIHGKGIIHRDIKGGNVLVDLPNNDSLVEISFHLIDFGMTENCDNPANLHDTRMIPVGTAHTMSTFMLQNQRAHPRDDLESLWLLLNYFLGLPDEYVKYCVQFSEACGKHINGDKSVENELTGLKKKLLDAKIQLCVKPTPELQGLSEFILYIRKLTHEDWPDYDYLEDLIISFRRRNGFSNRRPDWDYRIRMLLQGSDVLTTAIEHDTQIGLIGFKFNAFYEPLFKELNATRRNGGVIMELNVETKHLAETNAIEGTIFSAAEVDKLSINQFTHIEYISKALATGELLYFGFHCRAEDGKSYAIYVNCKTNSEIWGSLNKFILPIPDLHPLTMTQEMTNAAAVLHAKMVHTIDTSKFVPVPIILSHIPHNAYDALNFAFTQLDAQIKEKIALREFISVGYHFTWNNEGTSPVLDVLFVFQTSFNFLEDLININTDPKVQHTWSSCESPSTSNNLNIAERSVLKRSIGSSKGKNKAITLTEEAILHEFSLIENATNWTLAKNKVWQNVRKMLDVQKRNIRVTWQREAAHGSPVYKFTFTQDNFYDIFVNTSNANGAPENWLLKRNVPAADATLRQVANNEAMKVNKLMKASATRNDGLVIVAFSCEIGASTSDTVLDSMQYLNSSETQLVGSYLEEEVAAAAFGYAVSGKMLNTAVVYETLAYTLWKLINVERIKERLAEISLQPYSYEDADSYIKSHKLSSKSSFASLCSSGSMDVRLIRVKIDKTKTMKDVLASYVATTFTNKADYYPNWMDPNYKRIKLLVFSGTETLKIRFDMA